MSSRNLIHEIDKIRQALAHLMTEHEDFLREDVLALSRRLDQLILTYYHEKNG